MSASGPRSRGARVHPRPCAGSRPAPRARAASRLVLATQKLDGITGRGTNGQARRLSQVSAGRAAGARSARAGRRLPRVHGHGRAAGAPGAGRAVHGVRRPVLPQRLPARESDPGVERPRLPRPLARGDRAAPPDEQLPRVHRPPLPGAVRSRVRARDQRGQRGDDQADRGCDRESRLGGGLDRPAARRARAAAGAWPSSAPGRPDSPARSSWRRAGHAVTVYERDEAAGGLVRFGVPDFKIEKWLVERRVQQLEAEGVAFRFGVDVGIDVDGGGAAGAARRGRPRRRLARAARPSRARPRAGRRALCDGVPVPAQPLGGARARAAGRRRAAGAGQRDHRGREARDRDRRRRHGRRLRRERAS